MSCFKKPKTDEDLKQKEISKALKKHQKIESRTYRVPVVGAGESGKSTLLKQMQHLYIGALSDDEKRSKIKDIQNNIKDGILSITGAMKRIDPPVDLGDPNVQKYVDIIHNTVKNPSCSMDKEFFDACKIVWVDSGVQAAFLRSNEYQLIDSAKYFLDKIDIVSSESYIPDFQDVLRCRVLTSGIFETKFNIKEACFHMYDVGGQREERKKWIQVLNDVTAVIFVSAISAYDMTLREDPRQNRLLESIKLFGDIWNLKILSQTSIILFMNKHDLFIEKINSRKTQLETYFPEFSTFQTRVSISQGRISLPASHMNHNNNSNNISNNNNKDFEGPEVIQAKNFVKEQFLKISSSGSIHSSSNRCCYSHFTTAVDTDNIKRVFDDCQDMIRRIYMQKLGLI